MYFPFCLWLLSQFSLRFIPFVYISFISHLSVLKSQQAMNCPLNVTSTFPLQHSHSSFSLYLECPSLPHPCLTMNSTHPSLPSQNTMSNLWISHSSSQSVLIACLHCTLQMLLLQNLQHRIITSFMDVYLFPRLVNPNSDYMTKSPGEILLNQNLWKGAWRPLFLFNKDLSCNLLQLFGLALGHLSLGYMVLK